MVTDKPTVALALLVRMVIINQRKTPDIVKDIRTNCSPNQDMTPTQFNILERCALHWSRLTSVNI